VDYPERLSRWKIFVKWLLAFPHYLIVYALGLVAGVITFIAWFAILFTGRYPEGLFKFVVGYYRWNANVGAYTGLFRDEYPPFSWEPGQYPVTFEVDYPERLSRWLIFVKWLLVIPHIIVLALLGIVCALLYFIAFFAILFTGRFPRGAFNFLVGFNRWSYRINVYCMLMRDEYPPFSLQ
jgi:hypothetical protein